MQIACICYTIVKNANLLVEQSIKSRAKQNTEYLLQILCPWTQLLLSHFALNHKCRPPLAALEKKLEVYKSQRDSASEDTEQQKEISSKSDPSRSWLGILFIDQIPLLQ